MGKKKSNRNAENADGGADPEEPAPQAPSDDHPARPPLQGWESLLIFVALAGAAYAAGYLLDVFLMTTYGPESYVAGCGEGETFDCASVQVSQWGKLFGLPITIFALPAYAALACLTFLARRADDRGRAALQWLFYGAAGSMLYGLFLVGVMILEVKKGCQYCLGMDTAMAVVLVVSGLAWRRQGGPRDRNSALIPAALVGLLLLAVVFGGFSMKKSRLIAEYMEDIDAAGAQSAGAATAGTNPAAAASAPGDLPCAQPGAMKKTSDKPAVYAVPIRDCDATLGPADAKVTVVEYADFQCGYCKKLFYSLKPIKKKYADDVRFVFKHFPMNTACNDQIQNNRHRYACQASRAAECGRRQGRFWEMHDLLFKNQHKLQEADLRYYAGQVGLDSAEFETCMADPGSLEHLKQDVTGFVGADLPLGTPRTFINGRYYRGVLPEELLERVIDKELGRAAAAGKSAPAPVQRITPASAPPMTKIEGRNGAFWIDSFEASLSKKGKALSLPGVAAATANWSDAGAACQAAGKRLCTTEEWVTACQGANAVDDDGDGNFANDYVEGNQFPYADYYEPGWCLDSEEREGAPGPTGSKPRCVTPTGVFDLAGNVEEWTGDTEDGAFLLGGNFRAKDKAGCFRPSATYGPGYQNTGTGFRCCADQAVDNASDEAVAQEERPEGLKGEKLPTFVGELMGGGTAGTAEWKGKVTYLSFFASWCGPCRRELPELNGLHDKYKDRGFQVVAVGVDSDTASNGQGAQKSARMAKQAKAVYPVILDPKNEILGLFDVSSMPTTYIVGRDGRILHKQVGFGDNTLGEVTPIIEGAF